mgnify:CR=1 FL=1
MSQLRNRARFQIKLKDSAKKNIRNIINGDFTAVRGKKIVTVPINEIKIPVIHYSNIKDQGVSRGEGEEGDIIGIDEEENGIRAGNSPGRHTKYAEISIEEIVELLGEELKLPNIKPKGEEILQGDKSKYNTIALSGPRSLLHKKKTYKKALLRSIMENEYNIKDPQIILENDSFIYKSWKVKPTNMNNAAIFFMMDISGSLSREQLEIVRTMCFWIEAWLEKQYNKIDVKYIVHDTSAAEVTKEDFYSYSNGGGTLISSAFKLLSEIIQKSYPESDWNIYPIFFSDMENWENDDQTAIDIIRGELLPIVNQLSMGVIKNNYYQDWGNFGKKLISCLDNNEKEIVILTDIKDQSECYSAIKSFFSRGN